MGRTGHWDACAKVLPADWLLQSKAETVAIKRNNGRQRRGLDRFRRKSLAVSKSQHMVDLSIGLFAAYHINKSWNPFGIF